MPMFFSSPVTTTVAGEVRLTSKLRAQLSRNIWRPIHSINRFVFQSKWSLRNTRDHSFVKMFQIRSGGMDNADT